MVFLASDKRKSTSFFLSVYLFEFSHTTGSQVCYCVCIQRQLPLTFFFDSSFAFLFPFFAFLHLVRDCYVRVFALFF